MGGPARDTLDGGGDFGNIADYSDHSANVRVDLATGKGGASGEGDVLEWIGSIRGGSGDDVLLGDGNPNTFMGGPGADVMQGRAEPDKVSYEARPCRSGPISTARRKRRRCGRARHDRGRRRGARGRRRRRHALGLFGPGYAPRRAGQRHLRSFQATTVCRGVRTPTRSSRARRRQRQGRSRRGCPRRRRGRDFYSGGAGDDRFTAVEDQPGDFFIGGNGTDTIDFSAFKRKVSVTLGGSPAPSSTGTPTTWRSSSAPRPAIG